MWGWRSARAKSKAWEAARANAAKAAEKQPWPPIALAQTPPSAAAPPQVTAPSSTRPAPSAPRRLQYDGPSMPVSAPLYGRWVDPPADSSIEPPTTPVAAISVDEPEVDEPEVDEPEVDAEELESAVMVDAAEAAPAPSPTETPAEIPAEPAEPAEAAVTTLRLVPSAESPSPVTSVGSQPETQAEFLRLLEVVTSMCDHVIEYIEADRAERRMMIETLSQLSRTITDGARNGISAASSTPRVAPTELFEARERLVGGSMAAGPERDIDLRGPESRPEPQRPPVLTDASTLSATPSTEIAVEVRGRFGDRWVDGFEICEVMSTPDGPRYRLRRQRDGVVLPELFDATSIRHIETFEQLNGPPGSWSRS